MSAIRVLLVEDSPSQRELLVYVLEQDPALELVAVARDGVEAVALARKHRPDLIVMDVHMPRMNGYQATREILAESPTPIVMVSASMAENEVELSFEALRAGALTLMEKPFGPDHPDHERSIERLISTVKLMSEVKVVRRWRDGNTPAPRELRLPDASEREVRLIAIGASTGGPRVVAEILEALPRPTLVPILIVQHMAPGFVGGFARWLGEKTGAQVALAQANEMVVPGRVLIAPDDRQMGVTRTGRILLQPCDGEAGFCPSVTFLFNSVADSYGANAMGVILTGMGRDGAEGLLRIRRAGGFTVAQDAESCVVFGMPKEAIALGAVEQTLPPDEIAAAVRYAANPEDHKP